MSNLRSEAGGQVLGEEIGTQAVDQLPVMATVGNVFAHPNQRGRRLPQVGQRHDRALLSGQSGGRLNGVDWASADTRPRGQGNLRQQYNALANQYWQIFIGSRYLDIFCFEP
ncbi:MAG: hypothetical protein ABIU05_22335 [Nitrospirales bacterium]